MSKEERLLELYRKYFKLSGVEVIDGVGISHGVFKNEHGKIGLKEAIKVINEIKKLENDKC